MEISRFGTSGTMSQAVVHNGTVYLAGQVAFDGCGADAEQQTREVLARIDALLEGVGSDRTKLLSATIWLRNTEDFGVMNNVWTAWLDGCAAPARATVCGVELALPGFDVEIMATAAL